MCMPCFVWGWCGILSLAAERSTNTWHIHSCWKRAGPDTNRHAKSQRKQEKLSPGGWWLFNISFVSHPKEQLGKQGREEDAKERGRNTSISKTRTCRRTPEEIWHVIVRPLVRGQACDLTWPTLWLSALTYDLFCRGLAKHRPPAHNNEPLTRQGLTAIPVRL